MFVFSPSATFVYHLWYLLPQNHQNTFCHLVLQKKACCQELGRFNPCFNGFFFSIFTPAQLSMVRLFVSILVLMDSSFQYLPEPIGPLNPLSFNPCFNGFFFSIGLITTSP